MAKLFLNGSLVDETQARVSALDRGVVWGDGLFETLRVYAGHPWAFEPHYERLEEGSRTLDLPIPHAADVRRAIEAVLEANGLTDAGTRITITRGAGPSDPHADTTEEPNVIVTAWALRDYARFYDQGAALVTFPGGGRALPGVKTTSYAASLAGRVAARRAGADDALFTGPEGLVLETTGSNLAAIFDDELVTPPLSDGILPGITRAMAIFLAPTLGLRVREESMWLDDLFGADEVLLTSTLREVYPVRSIDGRETGSAGIAAALRADLRTHIRAALGLG